MKKITAPKGKKVLPKTFKKTSNEWYNDRFLNDMR